ncbi:ATP-binding protein [Paraglaciecola hydrolytica]|uniref:ATP-binding protein n=1 Tax=Paraglaciecola hydrolytica TaxID=1799789 RepID=UPI00083845D5|nr:ATP-binding protein [Paraglaciecola hydrolytica]
MAKLFISLYAFITLALVGLSAGLESLFFEPESHSQSAVVRQLLSSAKQHNSDLELLLQDANIPYRLLNLHDIAWPASSLQQLQNAETINLFDPQLGEQLYLLSEGEQLLEVSLGDNQPAQSAFILYRSAFFILLGALIALWIWPLWRDLEALKKSVATVMPDGNISENHITKSSLVAPIATSLNNMRSQIANLIQTQRELSGAVAHEFRTPLARLKFALGMQEPNQNEFVQNMQQDVLELEKLVQEMLDFSAAEAHMPALHFSELPISELCQSIKLKLKDSHLSRVQLDIQQSTAFLLGDGHFVERAIENLLLNASRYAKTHILISIETSVNFIDVHVEDDGIGIKAEWRDKIFQPFFRPDEGRDRLQGGAGLGLSIVRRVMQWHQGQCWVSQSQFGGAKFTLRFPNHA